MNTYAGPYIGPEHVPPFKKLPPVEGETTFNTWRRQLAEMSGYDNPFVQVPALAVRRIIADGEHLEIQTATLKREIIAVCDMLVGIMAGTSSKTPVDWLSALRELRNLAEHGPRTKADDAAVLPFQPPTRPQS